MVTVAEARQQLEERKSGLAEAREQVEEFEVSPSVSQKILRQSKDPGTQRVRLKELFSRRKEQKEVALKTIGEQESLYGQIEGTIAGAEVQQSAAQEKMDSYNIAEKYAEKGAQGALLVSAESKQIQEYYRDIVAGRTAQKEFLEQTAHIKKTASELGVEYNQGDLEGTVERINKQIGNLNEMQPTVTRDGTIKLPEVIQKKLAPKDLDLDDFKQSIRIEGKPTIAEMPSIGEKFRGKVRQTTGVSLPSISSTYKELFKEEAKRYDQIEGKDILFDIPKSTLRAGIYGAELAVIGADVVWQVPPLVGGKTTEALEKLNVPTWTTETKPLDRRYFPSGTGVYDPTLKQSIIPDQAAIIQKEKGGIGVSPSPPITLLSPKGIGKGAEVATTVGLLYTPILGKSLMAVEIYKGGKNYVTTEVKTPRQLLKEQTPTWTMEQREEYLKTAEGKEYSKEIEKQSKALKFQKYGGLVSAGVAAGFLGAPKVWKAIKPRYSPPKVPAKPTYKSPESPVIGGKLYSRQEITIPRTYVFKDSLAKSFFRKVPSLGDLKIFKAKRIQLSPTIKVVETIEAPLTLYSLKGKPYLVGRGPVSRARIIPTKTKFKVKGYGPRQTNVYETLVIPAESAQASKLLGIPKGVKADYGLSITTVKPIKKLVSIVGKKPVTVSPPVQSPRAGLPERVTYRTPAYKGGKIYTLNKEGLTIKPSGIKEIKLVGAAPTKFVAKKMIGLKPSSAELTLDLSLSRRSLGELMVTGEKQYMAVASKTRDVFFRGKKYTGKRYGQISIGKRTKGLEYVPIKKEFSAIQIYQRAKGVGYVPIAKPKVASKTKLRTVQIEEMVQEIQIPKPKILKPTIQKVESSPVVIPYIKGRGVVAYQTQTTKTTEIPAVKLGAITKQALIPVSALKTLQIQKIVPEKLGVQTLIGLIPKEKVIQKVIPAEKLAVKLKTRLIQRPKLVTPVTPIKTKPIQPQTPVPRVPKVPKPPFIIFPDKKREKRLRELAIREGLFIPFVKRYGKYEQASKATSFLKAKGKGISALRRTLGASLQIRRAKTKEAIPFAKPTKEFRLGKREGALTLVQKAPRRLGTQEEIAEIIRARRNIKWIK